MDCKNCGTELVFKGSIATPGRGDSYECPKCKEGYWNPSPGSFIRWADVEPEDVDMPVSWAK